MLQLALTPCQRGRGRESFSYRGTQLLRGHRSHPWKQQRRVQILVESAAEKGGGDQLQKAERQAFVSVAAASRIHALEPCLLPRLGCGREEAWVGLGSGWDMKLCPSISRAGIATFPLSNDKSYELCITGRSVCGCSYVEINLSLITYSKWLVFCLTESVSSNERTCLNLKVNSD